MPRITLNHYNLMTRNLDATVAFYTGVLGLRSGFYPGGLARGAWLYDSTDTPVLHTQEVDADNFAEFAARSKTRPGISDFPAALEDLWGSGTLDHVAFQCDDIDGIRSRLQDQNVPYYETDIASMALRQIFVRDPNGILLELNFPT